MTQSATHTAGPAETLQALSSDRETKIVDSYRVACDGGEGALGHPRVYLQIPEELGYVICPYCDCMYVHRDFADQLNG